MTVGKKKEKALKWRKPQRSKSIRLEMRAERRKNSILKKTAKIVQMVTFFLIFCLGGRCSLIFIIYSISFLSIDFWYTTPIYCLSIPLTLTSMKICGHRGKIWRTRSARHWWRVEKNCQQGLGRLHCSICPWPLCFNTTKNEGRCWCRGMPN